MNKQRPGKLKKNNNSMLKYKRSNKSSINEINLMVYANYFSIKE